MHVGRDFRPLGRERINFKIEGEIKLRWRVHVGYHKAWNPSQSYHKDSSKYYIMQWTTHSFRRIHAHLHKHWLVQIPQHIYTQKHHISGVHLDLAEGCLHKSLLISGLKCTGIYDREIWLKYVTLSVAVAEMGTPVSPHSHTHTHTYI